MPQKVFTFEAVAAKHGDCLYMNSGTCERGNLSWLSLDTATGEYALRDA